MPNKIKYILLVDDDEANNFYNKILLQQYNPDIKIESIPNGEDLINYVGSKEEKDWPVVVFLDLNMHLVDGPEFLEWYHKNGHQGKMKIFMFSASILPEDIERCMKHEDVLKYFEKPLDDKKLSEIMQCLRENS